MAARSAKAVIDQAIKENQVPAYLCYGFATAIALCGVAVVIWGITNDRGTAIICGMISTTLFILSIKTVDRLRTQNILLRVLERRIESAKTEKQLSDILVEFAEYFRSIR